MKTLITAVLSQFGIDGHLLIFACPVTSHSHLISHLDSPVLTATLHHQSTRYIHPSLTDFARLFFPCYARLSSTSLWVDFVLPTMLFWSPSNSNWDLHSASLWLPVYRKLLLRCFVCCFVYAVCIFTCWRLPSRACRLPASAWYYNPCSAVLQMY